MCVFFSFSPSIANVSSMTIIMFIKQLDTHTHIFDPDAYIARSGGEMAFPTSNANSLSVCLGVSVILEQRNLRQYFVQILTNWM